MGVIFLLLIATVVALSCIVNRKNSIISTLKTSLEIAHRQGKADKDELHRTENQWRVLSEILDKKFDDVLLRERLKTAMANWECEQGEEIMSKMRSEAAKEARAVKSRIIEEANAYADKVKAEARAVKDESDRRVFLVRQRSDILEKALETLSGKAANVSLAWVSRQFSEFLVECEKETERLWNERKRAAPTARQLCREAAAGRRQAEQEKNLYRLKCEYYENLFPFLSDIIDEDNDSLIQESFWDGDENPETLDDESALWLKKDEYEKLNSVEKGQRALDRWRSRRKSRWEIGVEYEDFIGYEYEQRGFHVEYVGMAKGFEDMGRDLICTKGQTVHIVQCKCWKSESVIHEKHINQLLGTSIEYAIRKKYCMERFGVNYDENSLFALSYVIPVFYTTTALSGTARDFASILGVEVHEGYPLKPFPQVKCNISKDGRRIYHLPFDQQYKNTKVTEAGECRVMTVAEAEKRGFRRARRHFGGGAA